MKLFFTKMPYAHLRKIPPASPENTDANAEKRAEKERQIPALQKAALSQVWLPSDFSGEIVKGK